MTATTTPRALQATTSKDEDNGFFPEIVDTVSEAMHDTRVAVVKPVAVVVKAVEALTDPPEDGPPALPEGEPEARDLVAPPEGGRPEVRDLDEGEEDEGEESGPKAPDDNFTPVKRSRKQTAPEPPGTDGEDDDDAARLPRPANDRRPEDATKSWEAGEEDEWETTRRPLTGPRSKEEVHSEDTPPIKPFEAEDLDIEWEQRQLEEHEKARKHEVDELYRIHAEAARKEKEARRFRRWLEEIMRN